METVTRIGEKVHALIQKLIRRHGGKLILEKSIISQVLKSQIEHFAVKRE